MKLDDFILKYHRVIGAIAIIPGAAIFYGHPLQRTFLFVQLSALFLLLGFLG